MALREEALHGRDGHHNELINVNESLLNAPDDNNEEERCMRTMHSGNSPSKPGA